MTLPHQEGEIEPGTMDQEPLEDVLTPAQMQSSHPSGLVYVREASLRQLSSLAMESFAHRGGDFYHGLLAPPLPTTPCEFLASF